MGKLLKILLFLLGGMVVLVVAAVLIVPKIIDVQQYKPMIEEKVAEVTGRTVSLGGDLNLSLFPWVGIEFSDFQLGNPKGYSSESFVKVKSFEAHVKVMPLLSKEVQIDSFVLDSPQIYLERRKDGSANWEGLGGADKKAEEPEAKKTESGGDFALKSIEVGEFAILNGTVTFIDKQNGITKDIKGLTLKLKDVSLDRPIALEFSAVVDGNALGLAGQFGPLGKKPGQGSLPLDLTLSALGQLEAKLSGKLNNPATDLSYDLTLDVAKFSPRKLMEALKMSFPVETSDPAALSAVALGVKVAGGLNSVAISNGKIVLDSSNIDFKGDVKAFAPLNLVFEGNLDAINLDKYMPPKKEQAQETVKKEDAQAKAIDYAPLRKLKLDTTFTVGTLMVQGGKVENIQMHLTADKGVFNLTPFSMDLYGGTFNSTASLNVQGNSPVTAVDLKTAAVQVGPMLKDFAKKDMLEGTLESNVAITLKGDSAEMIKKTLNGNGQLLFKDGAIVGIDLAGMVRNVQASFGLTENPTEKPRTDFAELRAPFTLKNGLFNTPETAMLSPLIRVTVAGSADLVSEVLDMKVKPKFVATLKGQGDTEQHSGLLVPVLVKGTFSSPEFSPDLESLLKSQLEGELPKTEDLKKALEEELNPEKILPKTDSDSVEKAIKGLIPKLSF